MMAQSAVKCRSVVFLLYKIKTYLLEKSESERTILDEYIYIYKRMYISHFCLFRAENCVYPTESYTLTLVSLCIYFR